MKIRITFKSPDGVSDGINDAVNKNFDDQDVSQHERDDLRDEYYGIVSKFVKYGEYVTIEIDTATGVAVVVPT
jgi:hypothetical protein